LQRVVYLSRQEAESLTPEPGAAIISISDSISYPAKLSDQFAHIKRMYFLDGVYGEESIIQFGPNFTIAFHNFFRKPHAEEIIAFLQSFDITAVTTLYVHCKAGESRSAAVAKYISEYFHIPAYRLQFGTLNQEHEFLKANALVYQLLCNPTCFDQLINFNNPGHLKNRDTSWSSLSSLQKIKFKMFNY